MIKYLVCSNSNTSIYKNRDHAIKYAEDLLDEYKKEWTGTCYNCKAMAEADENEMVGITEHQIEGRSCAMNCPCCGKEKAMLFAPVQLSVPVEERFKQPVRQQRPMR